MSLITLVLRGLRYYWRTQLATGLGVATATAVIAGALLVGDSVRDSLRQMSLDRLGGVDFALQSRRFFREALADELVAKHSQLELITVAPAIVMPGALERQTSADPASSSRQPQLTRAGGVNLYAVDERFWKLVQNVHDDPAAGVPMGDEIVLNRRTAEQLGAAVGDELALLLEIPPAIPRDSLLGDRDETVTELRLTVKAIAGDAGTLGRFGLNPNQQLPLNAYVPLRTLQQQLGLSEIAATIRNPHARPARVNTLFFAGARPAIDAAATALAESMTDRLHAEIELSDIGLKLTTYADRGYIALESEQMILESALASAGAESAVALKATTSPVFVYLLNQLGRRPVDPMAEPTGYSMYSVAAGIEFGQPPPFGPFEYLAGGPPEESPGPDDKADLTAGDSIPVVINDWLADDLAGKGGDGTLIEVGATFPVRYHVVGDRGELPEEELRFRVTGIVRLEGPADDQGFTPRVEGVTDVERYSDWREPFPLDHGAITDRDDDYWSAHKATPKVLLPLRTAQAIWKSRYGQLTSLRLAPSPSSDGLDSFSQAYARDLLGRLSAVELGMSVQPVKLQGLLAASGTTDFTQLFIGFSFFLIAAAMLLISLMFRLGIEQRIGELGLLTAIGMTAARVRKLFLLEGVCLALGGALLGIPAAVGYAAVMIYGLKTWWNRAVGTQFLSLSVQPQSLIIGAVGGVLVALLAIGWSLRQTRSISTRDLLHGVTEPSVTRLRRGQEGVLARLVAGGSLGFAAVLLVASLAGLIPTGEAFGGLSWRVVAFFLVGTTLLVGLLGALASWLTADRSVAVEGRGTAALMRLALRNASRNRRRSLLTASLIASAAFVIVAVASGKRNPQQEAPQKDSGNGGFLLVATSSQSLLYDLNTPAGRARLGLEESPLAEQVRVAPFRMRAGEDASCLNLYQTRLPTILGVPDDVLAEFDRESRFKFADTPAEHPWKLLNAARSDGRIPVLGDLNTLMFSLKKGLGDEIEIPAEALSDSPLTEARLVVAGMLDSSIFQGVLLMSERHFQSLFPQVSGFRYFLIEADPSHASEVSTWLESGLSDAGFDAEPVAARLADFLAVQNTYLSTFQTLGGLGLLLGTIGLATVMLRNVLERRSEFALLRAIGLTSSCIVQLVLWENSALLAWGLASGGVAALLAMWPHLASTGAAAPWGEVAGLLVAVFAFGMVAPWAAGREALRPGILSALRSE